jgi:(2Fe-2S) ferredoxin
MGKHSEAPECVFYTCCGSKCKKRGGKHLYKSLKERVKEAGLRRHVQVIKTGCTDRCKMGPVMSVMPANQWFLEVSEESAHHLFDRFTEFLTKK